MANFSLPGFIPPHKEINLSVYCKNATRCPAYSSGECTNAHLRLNLTHIPAYLHEEVYNGQVETIIKNTPCRNKLIRPTSQPIGGYGLRAEFPSFAKAIDELNLT